MIHVLSRFCGGGLGSDLSESGFCRWLFLEPQILVWLSTHYRLVSAKGVRHGVGCKSCNMQDIIGMR